ncbi:hypothetical protein Y032_0189g1226 [Ancylostoma ceylanicum]|uniref:Uncharacterized protein n=1 Tax=Ancylostoma ceylanicum TaxID=53326 RepID=A0A016SR76_9BILA|nr:hypothetical protein Y032_0189g1226 [Ancylostoma ceylanicum]
MESERAEDELEAENQLEKSDEYENSPEQCDEKEELDENADDELISIASSDLAMADEACEGSEEEEEGDLIDGLADITDEVVAEAFNPATFIPVAVKNIRPPWTKHHSPECDAKNWEIFVEALEAFDQDTILEGRDDFIVTIETLFPHLAPCFSMLTEDTSITEKDVTSRIMIWLEVCLGKDAQAFEEAKKLHDIAFEILKTIANAPAAIGQALIESGMMELLVEVIEDPGSAELRTSALRALFQLISSPSIWREANNRLCESNLEDPHGTLYSRLVAVSIGDRYFPSKNVLPLITLIVSWSRFVTFLTQLEASAREVFSAVSGAAHFNEVPVGDFTEKWNDFQMRRVFL